MAFAILQQPGYIDAPAGNAAAGKPVVDVLLGEANQNAKFGALRPELFYGEYSDGQEISKPVSAIDGYEFDWAECIATWEYRTTRNGETGRPSASGGLLQLVAEVEISKDKAKATSTISYYVQGGAQTNTHDGVLGVWIFAVRGRGIVTAAAASAVTDVADSSFNQDAALTQSNYEDLIANSKASAARFEAFIDTAGTLNVWAAKTAHLVGDLVKPSTARANGLWFKCVVAGTTGAVEPSSWPGKLGDYVIDGTATWQAAGSGYSNGQTVPLPVSDFDGYAYSRAEVVAYLPFWLTTGRPGGLGPTGEDPANPTKKPGRIRFLSKSVSAAGVVATQVNYWNGYTEEVTNDGVVGVIAICQRTIPGFAAQAGTFTDIDDSDFFSPSVLGDAFLKDVNQNCKFAVLRPECFVSSLSNGATVALPTSATDAYPYARAELVYPFTLASTGAGQGGLVAITVGVDPQTGAVTTEMDFDSGVYYQGTLQIATLGLRSHVTELQVTDVGSGAVDPNAAAPAAPTWVAFTGQMGMFTMQLAVDPAPGIAVFSEVELASDSAFTLNLVTISFGTATAKGYLLPRTTRFARARSQFLNGPYSAYTVFGNPTSVYSGHPADDIDPVGTFDPGNPRLKNPFVMYDAKGNPRHIFRYDDPAHTLDLVTDGATYKRLAHVNADNTLHISTPLNNQGSALAAADFANEFSYTSGTTTIDWSWSAFNIPLPDGSSIAVAASGASINFTGLTASTTYYFGVYYDLSTSTINIVKSDVSSGTAKESVAQVVQTINGDGHLPIATNMTGSTPASGSGGGSGGSGASCPAAIQVLETRDDGCVRAAELIAGTFVRAPSGEFVPVLRVELARAEIVCVRIAGEELRVEENHLWQLWGPSGSVQHWIPTRLLTLDTALEAAEPGGGALFPSSIAREGEGWYVRLTVAGGKFKIGRAIGHNVLS